MTTEHTYFQKASILLSYIRTQLREVMFNLNRLFNCIKLWDNHRLLMSTYEEKIKNHNALKNKYYKLSAIMKQLFMFNYRKTKKHNRFISKIYNVSVHTINNTVKSVQLVIEYGEKYVYQLVIYFKKSFNSVQHFTEIYRQINTIPVLIGCGKWCTSNSLEHFNYANESK